MTTSYSEFLDSKTSRLLEQGHDISIGDINPAAFAFQKEIIRWAVRKGRCCIA